MSTHDPLQPHSHDPNPETPPGDGRFVVQLPLGRDQPITLADLAALPQSRVDNALIVSTGHGTSGPFVFEGVALKTLVDALWTQPVESVEVVSVDGFGNRVFSAEIDTPTPNGPILLATHRDGQPLTRAQGLVRLIVPSETDDALRQVKWIGRVAIR